MFYLYKCSRENGWALYGKWKHLLIISIAPPTTSLLSTFRWNFRPEQSPLSRITSYSPTILISYSMTLQSTVLPVLHATNSYFESKIIILSFRDTTDCFRAKFLLISRPLFTCQILTKIKCILWRSNGTYVQHSFFNIGTDDWFVFPFSMKLWNNLFVAHLYDCFTFICLFV